MSVLRAQYQCISILFLSVVFLCGCAASSSATIDVTSVDADRKPVQLKMNVYRPLVDPPYPVVIDMHGCSGIVASRKRLWIKRMRSWGYALVKRIVSVRVATATSAMIHSRFLRLNGWADIESILSYILASNEFDMRISF